MRILYFLFTLLLISNSCSRKTNTIEGTQTKTDAATTTSLSTTKATANPIEELFIKHGLVDIQSIDSTIQVKLIYATSNNFTLRNLYGDLSVCYLLKEAAINLSKAQQELTRLKPGYHLLVTDGARPLQTQQFMWDSTEISIEEKYKFLSSPTNGSVHNYGAAVDVTILDEKNKELDMGTPIDCFSEISYPILESRFLQQKKLNTSQIQNRQLLRKAMKAGGYINLPTEWWHFNAWLRSKVVKQYALLDLNHAPVQPVLLANADITFKIQLVMVSKPIADLRNVFGNLQVEQYIHDNKYKYTTGSCKDLASSYDLRDKIRLNPEFKEAFVVAFNGTERIGVQDAIDLMQ